MQHYYDNLRLIYVNMRPAYVNMQDIDVNMRGNYVDMRFINVNMQVNYVITLLRQQKYFACNIVILHFHIK